MVDKPGLDDFFASKGKKSKKKTTKTATAAATEQGTAPAASKATKDTTPEASQKHEDKNAAADNATKKAVKPTAAFDDSDEEDTQIVLKDDLKSKFKETKDVQAKQKEQKMNEDGQRWMIGDQVNKSTADEPKEEKVQKNMGAFGGGSGMNINFGGKPQFGRANKTAINKQEFPELGDFDNKGKQQVAKKDQGYERTGGSTAAASKPRDEQPKMPVFFGKLKLDVGGNAEEVQQSKQNYDMSKLHMSSAASGKPYEQRQHADDDDDFEVVTEKKRVVKPREDNRERKFDQEFRNEDFRRHK